MSLPDTQKFRNLKGPDERDQDYYGLVKMSPQK